MNATCRTPIVLFATLLICVSVAAAQPAAPAAPAAQPAASAAAPLPSRIFAPSLAQLRQALSIARPEKWKAPAPANQETAANIASIQHDLDGTLPGLLATADSNPGSVAEVLPAYRNVEALYDVVLRVTEMSQIVAPDAQSEALRQALHSLDDARRTLGDQLQNSAVNTSHALVSLQGELHTAQSSLATAKAEPAPVCPTPAPAKRRTTTTTKPKSTTSTTSTTSTGQPSTATSH